VVARLIATALGFQSALQCRELGSVRSAAGIAGDNIYGRACFPFKRTYGDTRRVMRRKTKTHALYTMSNVEGRISGMIPS